MRTTLSLLVLALAGCGRFFPSGGGPEPSELTARAEFRTSTGQRAGTASLQQTPHGVLISVQLANVPPGMHGIHVHQTGTCEGPEFTTAGGHFNPAQRMHGFRREDGPHAGDLPNLRVNDRGTAQVEFISTAVTLEPGSNSLFDGDGSALVVHAGADDHYTDPSGNSGSRIACGVVVR